MRKKNSNDKSIFIEEVMADMGVSRNFIINAIEQGKFPGVVVTNKMVDVQFTFLARHMRNI